MPVEISLQLRAGWTMQPDTRQLHGLACALFEGDGAEHLGHEKPFAVWPLRPAATASDREWKWRTAWLSARTPPASVLAPSEFRLGHVTCTVTESRQRRITHAQLACGPPMDRGTVAFRSPTYFSHNGTHVVIPDPRLIVGSWRRRWNASLPEGDLLKIDEDTWQATHRVIHLASFDLQTQRRDSGRGRYSAGFTGHAVLQLAKDAPVVARTVFGTLARFAEFCGTGAQTTHGFGATTIAAGYTAT